MSFRGDLENIKLISGRSNKALAEQIATILDIQLVSTCLDDFANKELRIEIYDNIRNCDLFILQSGSSDASHSINDYLMELIGIASACTLSSARTVTAIVPCFPYARSDKKDNGRVPIMGSIVARLLEEVGITRIVSMDLHSGQIQGFSKIPFDNLFAIKLLIDHLKENYFKDMTLEQINQEFIVVSPDSGGIRRTNAYAERLGLQSVTMNKRRDYTKKNTVLKSEINEDGSIIKGKTAIIVDDMVDTMGTMEAAANELQSLGVANVIIVATHGIFSGPAFARINSCKSIAKVIVTNTLSQEMNRKATDKLEVVDTSGLLSEVIKRLVDGRSLSELFR